MRDNPKQYFSFYLVYEILIHFYKFQPVIFKFCVITQYVATLADLRFPRQSSNDANKNKFIWSQTEDVDTVDETDIVLKLPEPKLG